ncbi:MAG: sensor histidine kinase, partial [Hyphomicrobiales bacterium]
MVHVLAGPAPRLSTLRLDTLVKLRWMAVAGQLATVIGVHYGLGFDLPLEPCLALILVSATINLLIRLRNKPTERVNAGRAAAFLAYDIVQLAALLFLTGGLENPFAFL